MSRHVSTEPSIVAIPATRFWWQATPVAQATLLAQVYVISLFVFPTDLVYKPIGAQAFVAGLVSLALLFTWITATLISGHNPLERATRHGWRYCCGLSRAC